MTFLSSWLSTGNIRTVVGADSLNHAACVSAAHRSFQQHLTILPVLGEVPQNEGDCGRGEQQGQKADVEGLFPNQFCELVAFPEPP